MEQTLIEYFDNSEINQKLLKLFESKWDVVHKVCNAVKEEELWMVLHIACIPYNYEKMKYKILIVGQENNGWEFIENAKESMLFTLNFQSNIFCDNRLFFSFPYNFCASINGLEDNQDSKKSYLAWVNLREFSFDEEPKTPLNKEAQDIIDTEFNILEEEIKIINPDIVLFLTGPKYDEYIKKQLKGVQYYNVENYDIEDFAGLEHPILKNKKAFRIHHPRAFNSKYLIEKLNRRYLYNEFLNKLLEECQK